MHDASAHDRLVIAIKLNGHAVALNGSLASLACLVEAEEEKKTGNHQYKVESKPAAQPDGFIGSQ
jgi:hypothetical protein